MFGKDFVNPRFSCRKAAEFFDSEAIDLEVPIDRFALSPDLKSLLDERVKTLNNLAMCQMKAAAWDSAMASLRQVLKVEVRMISQVFRCKIFHGIF